MRKSGLTPAPKEKLQGESYLGRSKSINVQPYAIMKVLFAIPRKALIH